MNFQEIPSNRVKTTFSAAVAVILVLLFVTAITIIADLVPAVKNWLKANFVHHWIGKGVLSSILFVLVLSLTRFVVPKNPDPAKLLRFTGGLAIAGTLTIMAFFVAETFLR